MPFLQSLKLTGLLSFPPDSEPIQLTELNVLIGPNASGKSNLIEAIELLHATPTAFAAAIRDGGGTREWLWKGDGPRDDASIETLISGPHSTGDLRYRLTFTAAGQRTEVIDEALEEAERRHANENDVYFHYRFQQGRPVLNTRQTTTTPLSGQDEPQRVQRYLTRESLVPDESVLSQRKDPDLYPELTWVGQQFGRIQMFREWSLGRYAALRQPQPADLPTDVLLPDSRNLGLILNELEHSDASAEFNRLLAQFLPRYQRFSTRVQGGTVQFYLHEAGLRAPVPATRLSDGTIRFMAMLALLLSPTPPPLLCIEEPELGLHPDAVTMLADLLAETSSRTQLVVTTHADALVSALTDHADSVLVCEYRNGTVLRRVEPDRLRHWLNQYRLGEIWRIGELGGNP
jgi:predicted ATPase